MIDFGVIAETSEGKGRDTIQQLAQSTHNRVWFRDIYHDSPYFHENGAELQLDPFLFIARHSETLRTFSAIGTSVVRLDRTAPENIARNLRTILTLMPQASLKVGMGWSSGLSRDPGARLTYETSILTVCEMIDEFDSCAQIDIGVISPQVYGSLRETNERFFFLTTDPDPKNLLLQHKRLGAGAQITLDLAVVKSNTRVDGNPLSPEGDEMRKNRIRMRLVDTWTACGVTEVIMTSSGIRIWMG